MSSTPLYTATVNLGTLTMAAANTISDVFTAGASGSLTESIRIKANDSSSAYKISVYVGYTPSGPVNFLAKEIPVTAIIVDSVTPSFEYEIPFKMILPTGWKVRVSSPKAESITVIVNGGDF